MKRPRTFAQSDDDIRKLQAVGYRVVRYSDYHCRVFKSGSKVAVDLWPTAGKCMRVGSDLGADLYDNVIAAVGAEFGRSIIKRDDAGIRAMERFKRDLDATLASMGLR